MRKWATGSAVEWIRGSILESFKWKNDDNDDATVDEEQTSCLTKADFEREEELATAENDIIKKWHRKLTF